MNSPYFFTSNWAVNVFCGQWSSFAIIFQVPSLLQKRKYIKIIILSKLWVNNSEYLLQATVATFTHVNIYYYCVGNYYCLWPWRNIYFCILFLCCKRSKLHYWHHVQGHGSELCRRKLNWNGPTYFANSKIVNVSDRTPSAALIETSCFTTTPPESWEEKQTNRYVKADRP